VKVFWMEPANLVRVQLRRFTFSSDLACPSRSNGHDASVTVLDAAPFEEWLEVTPEGMHAEVPDKVMRDDPRWPRLCDACGGPFDSADQWQVNAHQLYRGSPDGKLYTTRDMPVGAMWDAWWMAKYPQYTGADGIALMVRTPGGEWMVDSRCSNCTLPDDHVHKCWVRHGDPRTGNIHVDKNGVTCSAGAGSIISGSYHGFLHNGELTSC
jgi:hypothetical protein